ncbi:signal recognition particle subunit [Coemansia asiatica]|uniref:Signal recognition particle subunit n=1 Tax=Coemansia asiatica TaxID=1052880 RepID=A0A9W7XFU0_9FUNG|nr:signal recognition particle subunit [Coemansia asiatica]KAJ2888195.1 signal recognition particle subunit [Coemansia asiatica]
MSSRPESKIEELDVDDIDFPIPTERPSTPPPQAIPIEGIRIGQSLPGMRVVNDASKFKDWICLYPLYFDKSRSLEQGRKVPLGKAIFAPHGRQLSVAVKQAGFNVCYEPNKRHPRDFFNAGRVRVELFNGGGPVNRAVDSRKKLMMVVAEKMALVVMQRDREPTLQDLIDSGAMPMLPGMGPGGMAMDDEAGTSEPGGSSSAKASKKSTKTKKKGKAKNVV